MTPAARIALAFLVAPVLGAALVAASVLLTGGQGAGGFLLQMAEVAYPMAAGLGAIGWVVFRRSGPPGLLALVGLGLLAYVAFLALWAASPGLRAGVAALTHDGAFEVHVFVIGYSVFSAMVFYLIAFFERDG